MPAIVVLDPVAEARPAATPLRERPDTLAGKRIGFLNDIPTFGATAAITRELDTR